MRKELERLQTGYDIVSKKTASGALGYMANHARKAMESASRQHYGNGNPAELKSVSVPHAQRKRRPEALR